MRSDVWARAERRRMSAAAFAAESLSDSASASIRVIVSLSPGTLFSRRPRNAESSRRAASSRSGASASLGTALRNGSITIHSGAWSRRSWAMPAICFESKRAHGISISASSAWLSTETLSAADQMLNSDSGESPSSCTRAWVMSATVWAWALHCRKRVAHSMPSTGTESSEATIVSMALLSCFRVTMCVRGVSAIPASASRNNRIGSSIPARSSGPRDDSSISSRQLFPRASKCPARFPLSTEETYLGSSG